MKAPEFCLGERVLFFQEGFLLSGIVIAIYEDRDGNIFHIRHAGKDYIKGAHHIVPKANFDPIHD